MIIKTAAALVLATCVWGVLDHRIKTRTVGTLALSLIGILSLMHLL
jgi:hypothetical protein